MKLVLVAAIICLSFTMDAQMLDGYKYVYIPILEYNSGRYDIWSISSKLESYFKRKGFYVLTDRSSYIPDEVTSNPCLLLRCEINHTNVTYGTNKVDLTLKNCNDKVVISETGGAMGLSLQDDYNKATKRAFKPIEAIKYSFDPNQTQNPICRMLSLLLRQSLP